MNFNNILNQIGEVEKSGKFDATTSSYFNYIDVSGTDVPPSTNNGLNQTKTAENIKILPYEQWTTEQKQADINAWIGYRDAQAKATAKFQEKNPDIDVAKILRDMSNMEDWSNTKIDQYVKDLEKKYGNRSIEAKDVLESSPDYYKYSNQLKTFDAMKDKSKAFKSKGTLESAGDAESFGWRNLVQRRRVYPNTEYYQYLEDLPETGQ